MNCYTDKFIFILFFYFLSVMSFSQNNIHIINVSDSLKYYKANYSSIAGNKDTVALHEVEIIEPVNPAYRLMDSVVHNRYRNDYEKIGPYKVKTYDKMKLIVVADSSNVIDLNESKLVDSLNNVSTFLMESLSQCIIVPPDTKSETVVATKMSGVKEYNIPLFLSSIVSISIYKDEFPFAGMQFLSPVNKYIVESNPRYYFNIEDTVINNFNDTSFILSFRPLMNQVFNGFVGTIRINSNHWAVESIDAKLVTEKQIPLYDFIIRQYFYRYDSAYWLPKNFSTVVYLNLLGTSQNNYMEINRYFYEYNFDSSLKQHDAGIITYNLKNDAYEKDESYWNKERYVKLSDTEKQTYIVLDSINEEEHIDSKLQFITALMTGRFSIYCFDLLINNLIHFNSYEGFSFGLNVETNSKFSDIVTLGGSIGYNFRCKDLKYSGYTHIKMNKDHDVILNLGYAHDLTEAGNDMLPNVQISLFDEDDYRYYLVNRMDFVDMYYANIAFRPFRNFRFNIGMKKSDKVPQYEYSFVKNMSTSHNTYHFATINVGMKFIYNERFRYTQYGIKSLGSKCPSVELNYERGMKNVLGGDYQYNKIELGVKWNVDIINDMNFSFNVLAGYENNNIPYSNLYNALSGYYNYTIFAPSSFATMRMNEFVSDIYAYAFLQYNFGMIFGNFRNFHLEPVLLLNCGYGNLQKYKQTMHNGIDVRTMNKGYYEAGLLINDIIDLKYYTMGVGACYRFGPYQYSSFNDNIAYKITIVF